MARGSLLAVASAGRRWRVVLVAAGVMALAAGGFALYRANERAAERREALDLAVRGNPAEAIPALQHCLDRDPDDPALLGALARTMLRAREAMVEVEPVTARWCAAAPGDPEPLRVRLDVLAQLGRYEDAAATGEALVALAPNDADARRQLIFLDRSLGRYDAARRECLRLLAGPGEPPAELRFMLAMIEADRGDLPAAARLLDQIPDYPGAATLRGLVHYRAGEYREAVADFRRVKPGPEERVTHLHYLGLALSRLGDEAAAREAFDELARVQTAHLHRTDAKERPADMALQVRAANSLLAAGQPEEAKALLEAAVRRNGPDPAAQAALAECLARLGRPDAARGKAGLP